MKFKKMPDRQPEDGDISIKRDRASDALTICVTTAGEKYELVMSEYNACRVFAVLSMFLGITLPKKVAEALTVTDDGGRMPTITIGFPEPKNLGEKVSQNLLVKKMKDEGLIE